MLGGCWNPPFGGRSGSSVVPGWWLGFLCEQRNPAALYHQLCGRTANSQLSISPPLMSQAKSIPLQQLPSISLPSGLPHHSENNSVVGPLFGLACPTVFLALLTWFCRIPVMAISTVALFPAISEIGVLMFAPVLGSYLADTSFHLDFPI